MKNCFNCVHKKVDLWNFNYSDEKAHSCLKGNNSEMLNLMNSVKGLKEKEVGNNFNLDCHEYSEHSIKMNEFLESAHKLLDEMKAVTEPINPTNK